MPYDMLNGMGLDGAKARAAYKAHHVIGGGHYAF